MSSSENRGGTNSSTPSLRVACSFSARTSKYVDSSKTGLRENTFETTCSVSSAVSPLSAIVSFFASASERPFSPKNLFPRWPRRKRISPSSGRS